MTGIMNNIVNMLTSGSRGIAQDPMLQEETFGQIQKIKSIFKQNLFQPYEKHLYSNESRSKQIDWFKILKKIATTQEVDLKRNLLPSYLFAIAVDSSLSTDEKKEQIADWLTSLEPEDFESFCYDFAATFPPAMSANILKFCPSEAWETMIRCLLHLPEVAYIEKPLLDLMKGAAQCPWPKEEQELFIDTIFEHFPTDKGNDILYDALGDESNRHVLDISSTMKNRIESLIQKIEQFGAKILGPDNLIKDSLRIPFHGNQRRYFVDWFYSHALSHPNSDLVALAFDKEDWELLQEKMKPSSLISCTMDWIKRITYRLENGEERRAEVWLFFSCASKLIKEKSKNSERQELICFWEEISALFSHYDLHHYLRVFPKDYREILLKNYVMKNSSTLARLIKEILLTEGQRENKQGEINNIFQDLPLHRISLVEYLFKNLPEKDVLAVFCALSKGYQEEVLQGLVKDRVNAIRILSSWIKHCLNSSAELPANVQYNIADNLYPMLMKLYHTRAQFEVFCCTKAPGLSDRNELSRGTKPQIAPACGIDPIFLLDLKNALDADDAISEADRSVIEDILPIHPHLHDPLVRQEKAFIKLKNRLSNPFLSLVERQRFVDNLQKDLKGGDAHEVTTIKLFQTFPKELWPAIFLYFEHYVCRTHYVPYVEKKTKGGVLETVDQTAPPKMTWMPDLDQWVELTSETLIHMFDNPYMQEKKDPRDRPVAGSMQHLYQALCETNTIHLVIKRFIETTPPEKFIVTMELFSTSCFHYNQTGFANLLSDCLNRAEIDKVMFLKTCLIKEKERREFSDESYSYCDLERDLWKKPYIADDRTCNLLAGHLFNELGIQFLGYFLNHAIPLVDIIRSIRNDNPEHAEELFFDCLIKTFRVQNDEAVKFKAFQNICSTFSQAGMDVLTLLSKEQVISETPIIQEWYANEHLRKIVKLDKTGLSLLICFNPSDFMPLLLAKISKIFTREQRVSFCDFYLLVYVLDELDLTKAVLSELMQNPSQLLETIRSCCRKEMEEAFKFGNLLPILFEILPDWKASLMNWVKETIKKEKEHARSDGKKWTPEYNTKRIFKNLLDSGKLELFINSISADNSNEFKSDLKDIYEICQKDRKEQKLKEMQIEEVKHKDRRPSYKTFQYYQSLSPVGVLEPIFRHALFSQDPELVDQMEIMALERVQT
jgi:hypothetical protein